MIVNARMYSVAPAAKAAWRELLEWTLEHAGVRMEFVARRTRARRAADERSAKPEPPSSLDR